VFELRRNSSGSYSFSNLSFDESNGANPGGDQNISFGGGGGLTADPLNGNLFGTTYDGGMADLGTVFEIAKSSSGYGGITTLLSFSNFLDTSLGIEPRGGICS
jgi:uncharacterized repeat protein (TIGR03803 family)